MLIPWDNLDVPSNPVSPIAQTFVGAACGIRRVAPYLFVDLLGAPVFPAYAAAAERFWERLCDPRPPEFQPVEPLGGQCPGIPYDAQLFNASGAPVPWLNSSGGGPIPGPIQFTNFDLRERDPAGTGRFRAIAFGFQNTAGAVRGRTIQDPAGAYLYDERWTVQLVRSDGLPDDCSIPPPPPPPPNPPPTTINIPVTVNNVSYNYDVTLPQFEVGDWPDFEFRPVFQIGDVVAEFTLGGINFPDINFPDWPDIPPIDVDLTPTLNAIADIDLVLQAGLGNINIQIENIGGSNDVDLTELEELIRCCACEEGVTYEPSAISNSTSGGSFVLPPNCVSVVIIASMPLTPSTPIIAKSGTEDDVYLWGTAAISYAIGTAGVVQRLSYQSQSFPVAEFAQNITVTPHYGNVCSIIAVTKVRNC